MVVEMPDLDGRGMTMSDLLARWARMAPASTAVRFDGRALSYAELDKRVNRLAWALDGRGIAAGDRVAVLAVNCLELFETYLACARMGAITVPINFRLVADEVAHILADSGASALIVHRSQREVATKACASLPELRALMVTGDSGDAKFESYERALASAPSTGFEAEVAESMPATIMYTSGTTGRPEGRHPHSPKLDHARLQPGDPPWLGARRPDIGRRRAALSHRRTCGLSASVTSRRDQRDHALGWI